MAFGTTSTPTAEADARVIPLSGDHISARAPNWEREAPRRLWDPTRRLLQSIRGYQRSRRRGGLVGKLAAKAWVIPYRFWSSVLASDVPLNAKLGGGLVLLHGLGVVIHPQAVVGPNCLIAQGVTLGTNGESGAPRLGGRVDVGPGAKILGDVEIGPGAKIGANAVVLQDVPAGALAVGVPARIIEGRGHRPEDYADPATTAMSA